VVAEGFPVVELIGGKCPDHDLVIQAMNERHVPKGDDINHGLGGSDIKRRRPRRSTLAGGGGRW